MVALVQTDLLLQLSGLFHFSFALSGGFLVTLSDLRNLCAVSFHLNGFLNFSRQLARV
jgi:hypothetical protein